jgi:hypothetical protein
MDVAQEHPLDYTIPQTIRLLPETAAELVFLHDAMPAIDKYCRLEHVDFNV